MKTVKKFEDILRILPPAEMLKRMGESMLDLADNIGQGDNPLDAHDKAMVRMAYLPSIDEAFEDAKRDFLAGHKSSDGIRIIADINDMMDGW